MGRCAQVGSTDSSYSDESRSHPPGQSLELSSTQGIVTPLNERMASQQSTHCEPTPLKKPILFHRLSGVNRTGWNKPAGWGEQG